MSAIAVCLAYSAEAADLSAPIPASLFGMTIHKTANYPTVPIGALGKGSCVTWQYIEQSRGNYDWTHLDNFVNAAAAHGVDITYSFDGVPSWALTDQSSCVPSSCYSNIQSCSAMPDNIEDFDDYVSALVTRYKGKIAYYELWNEPYVHYGNGISLSPSDLATLTKEEYNIIRSVDPDAKILTPSMDGQHVDYAQSYFAAGGPTGVDIASLHAYPDPGSASADVPEGINADRYLLGPLLPILQQYLPSQPVWDTEGSWNQTGVGNFITPDQEAAFIARWYILHWSNGISRAYWYAWDDPNYGTLMPSMNGSNTPAVAYQEIQSWLVGNVMSTPCAVASDDVTWTCGLTGPNGYNGVIVWNIAGDGTYTPDPSNSYNDYRDLAGNAHPYSGGGVATGIQPILLENGNPQQQ